MPQVYTAFASEVKVNEETIEGIQSIDYREVKSRQHVGAVGTDERIAVYFGLKVVSGRIRVASANLTLDGLVQSNEEFSILATLRHRDTQRQVSFDGCYMEEKSFAMGTEGHGETIYSFTATRLREE
ncbi:MAG: hypothetical protein U0002_18595 [Thermoanaerobaculia bacterium]